MPDLLFRLDQTGEFAAGCALGQGMGSRFLPLLQVADFAGCIVAPVLMTTETLPVISTLQAGLLEILVSDVRRVTVFAGGNAADLLEVVTILTSAIHCGHFRMQTMGETDGFVLILEFVDEHFVRSHLEVLRRNAWSRADAETGVGGRRCAAHVTLCAAVGRPGLLRDGFCALTGKQKCKTSGN